jgi:sulfur-oxidizing protein SoxX
MNRPFLLALAASTLAAAACGAAAGETASRSPVDQGRALVFDSGRGNCLACHEIEGAELAGNVGPPLRGMRERFPDRASLREQIWDAGRRNSGTIMPPFGRHQILTEDEIDKLVEFMYTL